LFFGCFYFLVENYEGMLEKLPQLRVEFFNLKKSKFKKFVVVTSAWSQAFTSAVARQVWQTVKKDRSQLVQVSLMQFL